MAYFIPPAGVTAASFFNSTVFVDPASPPIILGDNIDPATGEYLSILDGIHPVDAAVITAMCTRRGSGASVFDVGHQLDNVRKLDDSAAKALEYEVRRALQYLVDRKDMRIDKVVIAADPDGDVGASYVAYTNLQAQTNRTVRL